MTEQNAIDYSPDQAAKIIRNAFDQADAHDHFSNNLVYAVKPERGQVLITIKGCMSFDPEPVRILLREEFPRYTIGVSEQQVLISKNLGIYHQKIFQFFWEIFLY